MLGYGEEKLTYMKKHVDAIGKLSLHKDGTMANETRSTVPVFGQGDVDEGVNAANFRMVSRAGADGKERWVKQRNTPIIRDKKVDQMNDTDKDGIPNGSEGQLPSTKKALSSLRRSLGVPVQETYVPDPPTATRDINSSPNKEVYHGIDVPIADQGYPDKPLGLVSFKSYLSTPQTKKIEADKGKDMQAVHRDKAELSSSSTAYKQMIKATGQE
jgi:hypothetical protein